MVNRQGWLKSRGSTWQPCRPRGLGVRCRWTWLMGGCLVLNDIVQKVGAALSVAAEVGGWLVHVEQSAGH